MKDFYIYISSEDSMKCFPNNHASQFSVDFPHEIPLKGEWYCSLTEVCLPPNAPDELIICSSILEYAFVSDSKLPVLRKLYKKVRHVEFSQRNYVLVTLRSIQTLDIYVRDKMGRPISFPKGALKCTLHFKQLE